jgi:hypothetical protein
MTFQEIIQAVEFDTRMRGTDDNTKYLIKREINNAILAFVRLHEWIQCRVMETITLTDATSYDLSSLLSNYFAGEIALFAMAQRYTKKGLDYYQLLTTKTNYYAVAGGVLYVQGDAGTELSFLYNTPGTPHPMTDDSDENLAAKYYGEVVSKFAVIRVLEWTGEKTDVESQRFAQQINALKSHENRINKKGKFAEIHRHDEG